MSSCILSHLCISDFNNLNFIEMEESSKNWKAEALPSITGDKVTLRVEGDVKSGIIDPTLSLCSDVVVVPVNVIAFDVEHLSGGRFAHVVAEVDITGRDYLDTVRVFDKENDHSQLVDIKIEKVLSFTISLANGGISGGG